MDLTEIRSKIDKIDSQLIDLLKERLEVAAEIAEYKRENGKYTYKITVPANTECEFTPIGGETVTLGSGVYSF